MTGATKTAGKNFLAGQSKTSDASNKHKEFAKKIAEKYNLPLIEVGPSIFC